MPLPGYCKLTLASLPPTATINKCFFVAETKKWYYFDGTDWQEHNENISSAEKVQILSDIGLLETNVTDLDGRVTTLESSSTGVSDGDKGDITVSSGGTVWTVDNLPQSRITNLETDLAGKQASLVSGTNIKTINSQSLLGSGDIAISGSISDGDKGDITVSNNGAVWTVDNKQDTLISGTNIKTINNQSILGSGNITISGGTGTTDYTELWVKFNGANNSTDFVDDSQNAYSIISSGSPIISTSESKFGGSSLYLNGSSQLILSPINLKGDCTIECWVKTNNAGWNPIIAQCQSGIPANTWVFYTNNNSFFSGNYSASVPLIESTFNTGDNAWHHIAFVRKNNAFYLFIDGLLRTTENRNILNPFTSLVTRIGSDGVSSLFIGYMDNLRVSLKSMYTPTLYPNGFTLPDEAFNVTAL